MPGRAIAQARKALDGLIEAAVVRADHLEIPHTELVGHLVSEFFGPPTSGELVATGRPPAAGRFDVDEGDSVAVEHCGDVGRRTALITTKARVLLDVQPDAHIPRSGRSLDPLVESSESWAAEV
jgi:hypothetical protein